MALIPSSVSKLIGPRYIELTRNWKRTAGIWGGVLGVAFLFATDWQVVMGYVPFVRGKFKTEE